MIVYVPSTKAAELSRALWALARPPQVRAPGDSRALFLPVTDLQGGGWLMVDTEYQINVHAEAVLDGIGDVLQPWIDSGDLPEDTNETLTAVVESKRGQTMTPWEFFPQFFKDQSKDLEGMISAGLLQNRVPLT